MANHQQQKSGGLNVGIDDVIISLFSALRDLNVNCYQKVSLRNEVKHMGP